MKDFETERVAESALQQSYAPSCGTGIRDSPCGPSGNGRVPAGTRASHIVAHPACKQIAVRNDDLLARETAQTRALDADVFHAVSSSVRVRAGATPSLEAFEPACRLPFLHHGAAPTQVRRGTYADDSGPRPLVQSPNGGADMTHRQPNATRMTVIISVVAGLQAIALGGITFPTVAAQHGSTDMPAHAHPERFGSGWECDRGYVRQGDTCVAIEVPENAYLDSSGRGWKCDRGFRRERQACVPINVPANAFLTGSPIGADWQCKRGFRAAGDKCIAVKVPENGYPTYKPYGTGWECIPGYTRQGDACVAIDVPANAHLSHDSYGPGWECNPGYRVANRACEPVGVPEHAYPPTCPTGRVGNVSGGIAVRATPAPRSTSPRTPISIGPHTTGNANGVSGAKRACAGRSTCRLTLTSTTRGINGRAIGGTRRREQAASHTRQVRKPRTSFCSRAASSRAK